MRGGGFEGGTGVGIVPDPSGALPIVGAPTRSDRDCARVVKVPPAIVFVLIVLVAGGVERDRAVQGNADSAKEDAVVAGRRDGSRAQRATKRGLIAAVDRKIGIQW